MTWKSLVLDAIQGLPKHFSLEDLTSKRAWFAGHYPDNRFVDAKIRQTLQLLRDQGAIVFAGNGRYARTETQPEFSPLIHPGLGTGYNSSSQIARVVIETWAEMNLYCLTCDADSLSRHRANKIGSDFFCAACRSEYQVKAKNGRFGNTLTRANYRSTVEAANRGNMPEHILVEYDLRRRSVVFVDAIHGRNITAERILARTELAPTARRAGWIGCTISIVDLARTQIGVPTGLDRAAVRREWR